MTIQPVSFLQKNIDSKVVNNCILPSWTLGNGDQGEAVKSGEYADKTIQVYGAFSTGGSITLRGSNKPDADPATAGDWFTLTDGAGNNATFTSAGGMVIIESTLWISPACTSGDGSTAIICSLLAKKEG